MNIPMLQACIDGYQEHLFDMECLAVHQGHWTGYFQSKKPKPVKYILEKLVRDHTKAAEIRKNKGKKIPKPEVDVDRFLQREKRRVAFLQRTGKKMR